MIPMRIAILASIRQIRICTNIITKMLPDVVLRVNDETSWVVINYFRGVLMQYYIYVNFPGLTYWFKVFAQYIYVVKFT